MKPVENSPFSKALGNAINSMARVKQNTELKNYARASNLSVYAIRATVDDGVQLESINQPGTWVTIPPGVWSDDAADAVAFSKRSGNQIEYGTYSLSISQFLRFYGLGDSDVYDAGDAAGMISRLDSVISGNGQIAGRAFDVSGQWIDLSQAELEALKDEFRAIKILLEKKSTKIQNNDNSLKGDNVQTDGSFPFIEFHQDYPINLSPEDSNGGEEVPTINWRGVVADSLTIGGATVAFVGTATGALNALTAAQSGAIAALGNAAAAAGGALTAIIVPGVTTGLSALGTGAVLYRNIIALANRYGFAKSLGENSVYVEIGGNVILFSIGAYQTAESLGEFFAKPNIKNALAAAGSALATAGVGLASTPSAKDALQQVKYGRLNDLKKYLGNTKEFEVLGTGFAAAGTTTGTAAGLLPDGRPRALQDIVLESYSGGRAGVSRPAGRQQPA
ncbi:hypothetical protein [Burkholderia ubonensis]|uniref:hypothetical protein n=1 Tax=Burkholderia ubonensis TaxID=101571 RepID=UPI000AE1B3DA|nr:hypothetical protein [Burkholderia ubonensis]